jgi:hypothetical protein
MDFRDTVEWYGRLLSIGHSPRAVIRHWAYLLYRLLFGSLFIGFLLWWTFTPSAGARELWRVQQALKSATSWRESYTSTGMEEREEVACPSSARRTRTLSVLQSPEQGARIVNDDIDVGGKHYSMNRVFWPSTDSWTPARWVVTSAPAHLAVCDLLAAGHSVHPFPDWDRLIHKTIISRSGKEVVLGEKCQVWKAQEVHGFYRGVAGEDDEICIDERDHLPRRINGYIFYDWNQPVSIVPPDVSGDGHAQ